MWRFSDFVTKQRMISSRQNCSFCTEIAQNSICPGKYDIIFFRSIFFLTFFSIFFYLFIFLAISCWFLSNHQLLVLVFWMMNSRIHLIRFLNIILGLEFRYHNSWTKLSVVVHMYIVHTYAYKPLDFMLTVLVDRIMFATLLSK